MDRFNLAIGNFGQIHFIYLFHDLAHQSIQVFMIRAHSYHSYMQVLPNILISNFRNGDIEFVLDPVLDRFGDPPFSL